MSLNAKVCVEVKVRIKRNSSGRTEILLQRGRLLIAVLDWFNSSCKTPQIKFSVVGRKWENNMKNTKLGGLESLMILQSYQFVWFTLNLNSLQWINKQNRCHLCSQNSHLSTRISLKMTISSCSELLHIKISKIWICLIVKSNLYCVFLPQTLLLI